MPTGRRYVAGAEASFEVNALQLVARALLFNGVHPDVVEASGDPEEIFAAVLSGLSSSISGAPRRGGVYSNSKNALPPKPSSKPLKLEEVVPDSKQSGS